MTDTLCLCEQSKAIQHSMVHRHGLYHCSTPRKDKEGFTLIELSIVLVIIGLIVGGVLVGQSLIHAAELRAVARDIEEYKTAVHTFRLKYDKIPGDMNNATTFFGGGVVNGNGDKIIMANDANGQKYEHVAAWEHLKEAGLVTGEYDGVWTATPIAGVTFPKTSYPGATVNIAGRYSPDYMQIGAVESAGGTGTNFKSALTTQDAWGIDNKYDDGQPITGQILADDSGQDYDCLVGPGSGDTYDYDAPEGKNCYMLFKR